MNHIRSSTRRVQLIKISYTENFTFFNLHVCNFPLTPTFCFSCVGSSHWCQTGKTHCVVNHLFVWAATVKQCMVGQSVADHRTEQNLYLLLSLRSGVGYSLFLVCFAPHRGRFLNQLIRRGGTSNGFLIITQQQWSHKQALGTDISRKKRYPVTCSYCALLNLHSAKSQPQQPDIMKSFYNGLVNEGPAKWRKMWRDERSYKLGRYAGTETWTYLHKQAERLW